jgi:filamentous hemagglutinin family protein
MRWKRTLGAAAALVCVALPAHAQFDPIVLDGSLGPSPKITPDAEGDYAIIDDYGLFSSNGENLFHSFSRFDIPWNQSATFSSDALPSRVIARVTAPGDQWAPGSQINGTLRCTIEGADLFLLNPWGISFNDGAELEVQGSFHASSADVLRFADGIDFDARTAALPAELSTAEPSAFGFTSARPAPVDVFRSEGLRVPSGETLSFVGGEVTMVSRALSTVPNVEAPGARVQIAAVGDPALVNGPVDVPVDLADLDPADLPRAAYYPYDPDAPASCRSCGQISLSISAEVNVSSPEGGGQPAGSILIRGGRFELASSKLIAQHDVIPEPGEDPVDATGPIDVAVNGEIEIDAGSEVLASTEAQGRGGDVWLSGESVSVSGEESSVTVAVGAEGAGESGDLWITAVENTEVPDSGEVWVTDGASVLSKPEGEGAGGGIRVSAKALTVSSGGEITLEIDGGGEGPVEDGKIGIDVTETLTVENEAQIATLNRSPSGSRAGGGIEIDAGTIFVRGLGQIVSRSQGPGAGGPILLTLDGLEVTNAGRVQSEAEFGGAGGPIEIHADSVLVSNQTNHPEPTFIATNTLATSGGGDGGDLTVHTNTLDLVNGGQLFARTEGSGRAGVLEVLGADFVHLSGVDDQGRPSGITGRATETATAEASGSLSVETRILEMENGAQISSATFGRGNASPLTITAETVTIRGGEEGATVVSAASRFKEGSPDPLELGSSGNLTIDAETVTLEDGGQVSVSTAGGQAAGDIWMIADNVSISGVDPGVGNPSGVFAQSNAQGVTGGGAGGDIKIEARENLSITDGGWVSVRAEPGSDGDAGVIRLDVGKALEVDSGGTISALSGTGTQGEGGSITIRAGELVSLTGGSEISAASFGSAKAGKIKFFVPRFESRDSFVTTDAKTALGGEIEIHAAKSVKLVDSIFTTSVFGEPPEGEEDGGHGGNIDIGEETVHPELVVLNRSTVKANSLEGRGGTIMIWADALLKSADSVVEAKAQPGLEGIVEINAPEVVLAGELATLPESFLDVSALLTSACEARTARAGSFVVQRRAALPAPPDSAVSLASAGLPAVSAASELPQCPLGEEAP